MNALPVIYKACQVIDNEMYSIGLGKTTFGLQYQLNQWTTAKVGGILCCSLRDDAERLCWAFWPKPYCILRCIGEQQIPLPQWRMHLTNLLELHVEDSHEIQSVWENNYRCPSALQCMWPKGTLAYQRVKPLEIVKI